MNFTENQQNAINVRDCSLIISAGAGSGKTAVLTERILERICDENDDCNIDDFLIVTFTKAAAKELSDRIRKKLSDRALKEPTNKKIVNNIALLPLAKISTINSFCYEIVKNNFQKIGLSASVRIADEAEMDVIRERIINEVIDEYFEENGDDEEFLAVYEIFASAKNDKGFVSALLDVERKLSSLPDPEGFCNDVLESYREVAECDEFFDTKIGASFREKTLMEAKKAEELLEILCDKCRSNDTLADKYLPSVECELNLAKNVIIACDKGYSDVKQCIDCAEKVSFKAIRNFEDPELQNLIKDAKALVSGQLRDMLSERFCCDEALLCTCASDTEKILSKLFEIVNVFKARLSDKKQKLSVMEFSDAERYALGLLVESFSPFEVTPLAKQLRERYTEVYIDEYQDVNPLQDMIFKALSRRTDDGTECSRFMVGDIKQSIYRFRGASSEIFMHYRDTFRDIEEKAYSKRIFMNDNFRCSESVIGFTNYLFASLMGDYYLEGDKLLHSRIEDKKVEEKVKFIAFDYDKETAEGVSATELEAALICREIKKIVGNPAYTDSNGKMYTLSDVAILARSKAALKVYEKVLGESGISAVCDVGESFYGRKEILLCMNILNAIDNPERDIYLAGFMRSFAGGFSDDELAIIKKDYRNMSLYRAVINYSCEKQDELSDKCREFVETLREYRTYSRGKSADKLLWKLYCDMDLLSMCSSSGFTNDKKGTRKNLLKLYQMARDFSATSFRGTGAFIEYINGSMDRSDVKAERELVGDCVSIMTIHSSKGLEFPVCFVSDLSRRFNKSDETSRLVFSEKAGVAVTLCDTQAIESVESNSGLIHIGTPYRCFVAAEIDRDMIDEEIRILYVALTRARDMLIMTTPFGKKTENVLKDAVVTDFTKNYSSCGNFTSLILGAMAHSSSTDAFFDVAGVGRNVTDFDTEKYFECKFENCADVVSYYNELSGKGETQNCVETDESEIDGELLRLLLSRDASKKREKAEAVPSKVTVSFLKKGLIDEEKVATVQIETEVPLPRFISGDERSDAAQKGTAMHLFMQFADYESCEKDCSAEADRMVSEGFIDKKQRSLLDLKKLGEFFGSEFYKNIKKSGKIYREQRFNLDLSSFDSELSGDVLVQGVIDLFYENSDGTYAVVDFKTDRVFGDDAENVLIDRHKEQLMYYKRAVEEMTGKDVKNTYIYSFSLMKEIEVC